MLEFRESDGDGFGVERRDAERDGPGIPPLSPWIWSSVGVSG